MNGHLTLRDRVKLQYLIENQPRITLSKSADCLAADPSTIYRELKSRAVHHPGKNVLYNHGGHFPECGRLHRFPYTCNACEKKHSCSRATRFYDAYAAQAAYEKNLRESRKHPYRSEEEMKALNRQISPLIFQGQSLYAALEANPQIHLPESSARRYIERGYFDCRNIDLPRTVRFQHPWKAPAMRIRPLPVTVLHNRTFQDYQDYCASSKRVTLQLDTVIGKLKDNHFILTLFEPQSRFQWGYVLPKSAKAVNQKILKLTRQLTAAHSLFFDCILTDNGFEFQLLPLIESDPDTGELFFRVFFCDPYASFQKGGCERNHEFLRFFYQKGKTLDFIQQYELDEIFSQIDSLPRKSLGGKTSFQRFMELFQFDPSSILDIHEIVPEKLRMKK